MQFPGGKGPEECARLARVCEVGFDEVWNPLCSITFTRVPGRSPAFTSVPVKGALVVWVVPRMCPIMPFKRITSFFRDELIRAQCMRFWFVPEQLWEAPYQSPSSQNYPNLLRWECPQPSTLVRVGFWQNGPRILGGFTARFFLLTFVGKSASKFLSGNPDKILQNFILRNDNFRERGQPIGSN